MKANKRKQRDEAVTAGVYLTTMVRQVICPRAASLPVRSSQNVILALCASYSLRHHMQLKHCMGQTSYWTYPHRPFCWSTLRSDMAAGGLGNAETVTAPQPPNADAPQKQSGGSRHTKAARVEVKQPTKVEAKQPAKSKFSASAHR